LIAEFDAADGRELGFLTIGIAENSCGAVTTIAPTEVNQHRGSI